MFLLVVETLMLVLVDAQVLQIPSNSPALMYVLVAQVILSSASCMFFIWGLCFRLWGFSLPVFIVIMSLLTNVFILICTVVIMTANVFSDIQARIIRIAFIACRSFNCAVYVFSIAQNHWLRSMENCMQAHPLHDVVRQELPRTSASPLSQSSKLKSHSFSAVVCAPSRDIDVEHKKAWLKRISNRVALLESSPDLRDYFASREELERICQPSNRLLVSVGSVWASAAPAAFDMLDQVSLGGHLAVDCFSNGRCGLEEFFGVCTFICKWLQSSNLNTVVIFHQGPRSCAAMLACGVLMVSGLFPRCEHALHVVLLSFMLHNEQDAGQLTSAGSRRMLRHFDCFLRSDVHPARASPRFLEKIELRGCMVLPAGVKFSVDIMSGNVSVVKSGKWFSSFNGDSAAREMVCQYSPSSATCYLSFETECIMCKGDFEIIISVENESSGASVQVATLSTHSSFCGSPTSRADCYSAADVDWQNCQSSSRLFSEAVLHFATEQPRASLQQTPPPLSRRFVDFHPWALSWKGLMSSLISKGTQLNFSPGDAVKTAVTNIRSSGAIIVLRGVCSVELLLDGTLKPVVCLLPTVSAGQMLPSLQVLMRQSCANKITI
jgi:hypothetical protein